MQHSARVWLDADLDSPDWEIADAGFEAEGAPLRPMLALGEATSCLLDEAGAVRCWGVDLATLGRSVFPSVTPWPRLLTGAGADVRAISAGNAHACALFEGGSVRCWGSNRSGHLGIGSADEAARELTPLIALQSGTVAISVGVNHACAALVDGSVRCWGANEAGQLGVAATGSAAAFSATPVRVAGLAGPVRSLATGLAHTCALLQRGLIQCWGRNDSGECGAERRSGPATEPSTVLGLPVDDAVVSIGAGHSYTCSLQSSGRVYCWGALYEPGELGRTRLQQTSRPTLIEGFPRPVRKLAVGPGHACGVDDEGQAHCFRQDDFGQLGNGGVRDDAADPTRAVTVLGLAERVRSLGVGSTHSCALLESGHVQCWGFNRYAQLGDGMLVPESQTHLPNGTIDPKLMRSSAGPFVLGVPPP